MTAPLVDVVIVHYNRPRELAETLGSLREHLRYPNLRWVVADDHSPDEVFEFIKAEVRPDIIFRTKERSGVGINVNNALRQLTADFIFFGEDDRVLKGKIDLMPGVDLLARYPEFGMVRYGGLLGHDLTCRLRQLQDAPPYYNVWEILKEHSRFLYAYSGAPHLKHRRFHEAYGLYVEGYKLGVTEDEFAHRFGDKEGPSIVCFPEFVNNWFDHIGGSRQLTEDDVGWGLGEGPLAS